MEFPLLNKRVKIYSSTPVPIGEEGIVIAYHKDRPFVLIKFFNWNGGHGGEGNKLLAGIQGDGKGRNYYFVHDTTLEIVGELDAFPLLIN